MGVTFFTICEYMYRMCVYKVLQFNFIIMKNIFGSFKSKEFKVNGVEFLNESDMQKIRGGEEAERQKSRPREILPEGDV